jgi:hypothetical protein
MKPSPVAETLRSFLLPGSPRPVRHGTVLVRAPLREPFGVVAFTGWRALSSFDVRPLSCCHDALRTAPTSGLCSTEELVAATQRFRCAPLDAPMGFGSTRSDAAARFRAAQTSWAFRLRVNPAGVPTTRTSRGRQSVSALSGSGVDAGRQTRRSVAAGAGACDPRVAAFRHRPCGAPKGAAGIDRIVAPAPPERGASAASQPPRRAARTQVDPPEGNPRIGPDRPKAIGFDAGRVTSPKGVFATQQPTPKGGAVVRARAPHSSAVARVPLESPLAADSRRPKALVVRAPLVARIPKDAASNPAVRPPKESRRTGEPVGHPKVVR